MKKYILLSILVATISSSSYACEICGCANNNFQIGLLPTFNKGFLGFRYSYSRFNSEVHHDPTEYSRDYYQTMELWGGYNFKKLQVMGFMPYVHSRKENNEGTTISNGAGDLMLLANYKILSLTKLSKNEKVTVQNELFAGGGIKLPTGLNQVDASDPDFNIGDFNSQAGTGSVDYILNATHNLLWNKSGLVTNVAYRINTANEQDYKFGNRSYVNTSYFYTITKSKIKIKPTIGINFQSNTINHFEGEEVEHSNGYNFNTTVGANLLLSKIGINALAFIPTAQNNYDGQTKMKSRFITGITYSF